MKRETNKTSTNSKYMRNSRDKKENFKINNNFTVNKFPFSNVEHSNHTSLKF